METRSCAERTILGRLRSLLDSGVVGDGDHIEFTAHMRDGGRRVDRVRLILEMLTPEGDSDVIN
jgi:hypothetical protein